VVWEVENCANRRCSLEKLVHDLQALGSVRCSVVGHKKIQLCLVVIGGDHVAVTSDDR
jgi:hypothetical protein